MISIELLAAQNDLTVSEYFSHAKKVNAELCISGEDACKVQDILAEEKYCNMYHYAEENSKRSGHNLETRLVNTLGLDPPSNTHHDATDTKRQHRVEIKSYTALSKDTKLDYVDRALYMRSGGLSRISAEIFQHVKPSAFEFMIGAAVFMDGIALYMIKSSAINSSTLEEDRNSYQYTMTNQQAGHASEGTLPIRECQLVATIEGCKIHDIALSYEDLVVAFHAKDILILGSESVINRFKFLEY